MVSTVGLSLIFRDENMSNVNELQWISRLCPICDTHVCMASKARHEKTIKHQNALKESNKSEEIIEI